MRTIRPPIEWPPVRAVAFDLGHTLVNERVDLTTAPFEESHLMPGAREVMEALVVPAAIWANTRSAGAAHVRGWLVRAGLSERVQWIVTSQETEERKPGPRFFSHALRQMNMDRHEVLFVGNQMNTDIIGADSYGIRSVYLCSEPYRSPDDRPVTVEPTYTIQSLRELPALLAHIDRRTASERQIR